MFHVITILPNDEQDYVSLNDICMQGYEYGDIEHTKFFNYIYIQPPHRIQINLGIFKINVIWLTFMVENIYLLKLLGNIYYPHV